MAPGTRSKKIEIREDNTAEAFGAQPHTSSQTQQLAEGAGNAMAGDNTSVKNQLKDLKEAYREAIGVGKKTKKGKNKKMVTEHNPPNDMKISDSKGNEVAEHNYSIGLNNSDQPVQPAGRTTRGRAKAQEGPYEDLLADELGTQVSDTGRTRDGDFLMSLIAGRSSAYPRNLNNFLPGGNMKSGRVANTSEALKKAIADIQAPDAESLRAVEDSGTEEVLKASPNRSGAESVRGRKDGDEDSFVEHITSRSPAKSSQSPSKSEQLGAQLLRDRDSAMVSNCSNSVTTSINDQVPTPSGDEEDSFIGHISSRSPVKQASRIEDSVEALDQMEEVEEALHEAAMAERLVSPEKKRQKKEQPAKAVSKSEQLRAQPRDRDSATDPKSSSASQAERTKASKQAPVKTGFQSMRIKSAAPKHAPVIKRATSMIFKPSESSDTSDQTKKPASVKRPTSLLPPKEPVKSTKPTTRPTNFELPGEAIARKLKEKREQRLAQRESSEDSLHTARTFSGPAVKSTKPLTKPSFELPGEALSRKKREAHEAKLKAQEEEERKRREFKAKPVRKSILMDTVSSRARQSRNGLENIEDGKLSVSKRNSMNVGAHRPSIVELTNMVANTSAPRAPGPLASIERKPSTKFHGPSMSGLAMQRTVSATEVQLQRQRAKEIYNRDQKLTEEIEKDKREREAAAKRSREQAAERGRQASREWAEKQRMKKLAEGDKGMSTGYGPGGQMGLSG